MGIIKDLEMRQLFWIIRGEGSNIIIRIPIRGKQSISEREIEKCYAAVVEDGGRDHKPRNVDNSRSW